VHDFDLHCTLLACTVNILGGSAQLIMRVSMVETIKYNYNILKNYICSPSYQPAKNDTLINIRLGISHPVFYCFVCLLAQSRCKIFACMLKKIERPRRPQ
jgi:hypothetical protein